MKKIRPSFWIILGVIVFISILISIPKHESKYVPGAEVSSSPSPTPLLYIPECTDECKG